jgi:FAD/FMN-containing dehydrogenase
MENLVAKTIKGEERVLKRAEIEQLRSALRGEILTSDSPGYEVARRIWNGMIDRRPALIVRAAGTADIIRTVEFARSKELLMSVRGGGHNVAGNAVAEGGLMLDLSALRWVQVDPVRRRAVVGPGAVLGDFDHEAQSFGLATPLGVISKTGVAGLTLGGGVGWLSRKFGLTVDNLLAADVVTADAKLVRANDEENPDLFWAVRGGGGNFGVVTRFEFKLQAVGPEVLPGLFVYPLDEASKVLREFREYVKTVPDELSIFPGFLKAPPLPFLPAEFHGRAAIVLASCYIGEHGRGVELIRPLGSFGKLWGSMCGPMPYVAWQRFFDDLGGRPGARNYWKNHNLSGFSDGLIDALIESASKIPSVETFILMDHVGGQIKRPPAETAVYGLRDAEFTLGFYGRWEDPADDEQVIEWVREGWSAAKPHATGSVYVNYMMDDEAERLTAVYGPHWERLRELKSRWDPDNFFRMNQNIAPQKAV